MNERSDRSIRARAPQSESAVVRRVMLANLPGKSRPEQRLRGALFARGVRFRKDQRPVESIRCRADIVFPTERLCVFVHGCFWHGCDQHFRVPKSNSAWWREKVQATKDRDHLQQTVLERRDWMVLTVWEHELSGTGMHQVVQSVVHTLVQRRELLRPTPTSLTT